MSATSTAPPMGEETEERTSNGSADPRKPGPFGGLTPSEAAKRRHAKEREEREAREAEHEERAYIDGLTVSGRVTTALARKVTYEQLLLVLEALLNGATKGDIKSAGELRQWLALSGAGLGDEEPGKGTSWEDMTKEQRAALRARLEAELHEIEHPSGDAAESDPPTPATGEPLLP